MAPFYYPRDLTGSAPSATWGARWDGEPRRAALSLCDIRRPRRARAFSGPNGRGGPAKVAPPVTRSAAGATWVRATDFAGGERDAPLAFRRPTDAAITPDGRHGPRAFPPRTWPAAVAHLPPLDRRRAPRGVHAGTATHGGRRSSVAEFTDGPAAHAPRSTLGRFFQDVIEVLLDCVVAGNPLCT